MSSPDKAQYLEGWNPDQRIKCVVSYADVTADIYDARTLVYLSSSSGIGNDDLTRVFDILGSNSKKIAFTEEDGVTQIPAEIVLWDDTNEKAWIYVLLPFAESNRGMIFYMYFDNDHDDNTDYICSTPNDSPAHTVWGNEYILAHHLVGASVTALDDSTRNNEDATTETGSPAYNQTEAKVARSVHFDPTPEGVNIPNSSDLTGFSGYITWEAWIRVDNLPSSGSYECIAAMWLTSGDNEDWVIEIYNNAGTMELVMYWTSNGATDQSASADFVSFSAATWYKIAIVWQPNTVPLMYVNGSSITASGDTTATIHSGTSLLRIGNLDGSQEGWDGHICGFRMRTGYVGAEYHKYMYESENDSLITYTMEREMPWEEVFERNNLTKWDGTFLDGGTLDLMTTDPHHGRHHVECDMSGSAGWDDAYMILNLHEEYILYCRAYFKFKTAIPDSTYTSKYMRIIEFLAGTNEIASIGVESESDGDQYINLRYRDGATMYGSISYETFKLDKWYCFELYCKIHATAGEAKAFMNGREAVSVSSKDTADYGHIDELHIGTKLDYLETAHEIYIDCIKLSRSYIGPEPDLEADFETNEITSEVSDEQES